MRKANTSSSLQRTMAPKVRPAPGTAKLGSSARVLLRQISPHSIRTRSALDILLGTNAREQQLTKQAMKKTFHFIISTAAASFLVSTSFAQDTTNQTDASAASSLTAATNARSASAVAENTNVFRQQPASSTALDKDQNANPGRTNDVVQTGTNAVPDADNSARNERDRHNQTLTPGDQGHNSADFATTRAIRKEITSTKDLSMSARNVKIITTNGVVTLRGPVKTENEKRLIGEIASKVAQSTNVDNQLEVKLVPTGRN